MELTEHRCSRCGAALIRAGEAQWKCRYCGCTYDDTTAAENTKKMRELFDEVKLELVNNLRRNLYDATNAEYISSVDVKNACVELKKYLPDDFSANFYEIAVGNNVKRLTAAIRNIDVEAHLDEVDTIIKFLIKSLQPDFLLELNNLAERAYKSRDLKKFEQIATEISMQAEKMELGIYETRLPREVFVAYSSKDMRYVSELVEVLEGQGLKCFVAARNLRHGKGAVENYDRALKEAMDYCKSFVFVSTLNSRSFSCDALEIEIPYVRKQDLQNTPAEYRHNYATIPHRFKKPRVEYRVEESRKFNAADQIVKEFFDGYEWVLSPDEVAVRVMKQIVGAEDEPSQGTTKPQPKKNVTVEVTAETVPEKKAEVKAEPEKKSETVRPVAPPPSAKKKEKKKKKAGVWVFALLTVCLLGGAVAAGVATGGFGLMDAPSAETTDSLTETETPADEGSDTENTTASEATSPSETTSPPETIPPFVSKLPTDGFDIAHGDDNTAHVAGIGNVTVRGVVIPGAYEGLPVTSIDDDAFFNNKQLTSLTVSDGVTTIGNRAFYGCAGLTEVAMADSVTSIGEQAFFNCTSITSLRLSNMLTTLPTEGFSGCTSLTSVTLPAELTSIGARTFYRAGLTSITIPEGVEDIGDMAFAQCGSLTSVTFPSTLTDFGVGAFSNCYNLKTITIPQGTSVLDTLLFSGCSRLESITFPASVTLLGDQVFMGCTSLTEIRFGGTMAQFMSITKGVEWSKDTGNFTVYCSDGSFTK